jgi:hypothetical protein
MIPSQKILAVVFKFNVYPSNKHCPSARQSYAVCVVRKYLDMLAIEAVSLNYIS